MAVAKNNSFLLFITILFIINLFECVYSENKITRSNSLKLVHVIFRHGDRTPSQGERYPNDPRLNFTYPPFGTGQLTDAGKKHSYILGTQIRNRYDSFLGNKYYYGILNSTATNVQRTQTSLQCVHAGLFLRTREGIPEIERYQYRVNGNSAGFNYDNIILPLEPIPYEIASEESNNMFSIDKTCTSIYDYPEEENLSSQTRHLLDYVAYWTGYDKRKIKLFNVAMVYDTIKVDAQLGFPVPSWAEIIYPRALQYESLKSWNLFVKRNLRLSLGKFAKKINTINVQKMKNELQPAGLKMYLYSCHDTNIVSWLGIMDYKLKEDIEYNAQIYIELHVIEEQYFIKVLLKNGINAALQQLQVKGCDHLCPLQQFIELTEWLYNPTPVCQ